MRYFRNRCVSAGVGAFGVVAFAAAEADFAKQPFAADLDPPPIPIMAASSSSTSAQPVLSDPILDGVAYVVDRPEEERIAFASTLSATAVILRPVLG